MDYSTSVAEYLQRARRFEQLAAEEKDSLLKAELERQANGQRQLAEVRAKQVGKPLAPIEKPELAERLVQARQAVAEGDTNIQHQRELIARLKRDGQDASEARVVLDALLKRQAGRHAILRHIIRQFPPEKLI